MMQCQAIEIKYYYDEEGVEYEEFTSLGCSREARWLSCTPLFDVPVCSEHKCRCGKRYTEQKEIK